MKMCLSLAACLLGTLAILVGMSSLLPCRPPGWGFDRSACHKESPDGGCGRQ